MTVHHELGEVSFFVLPPVYQLDWGGDSEVVSAAVSHAESDAFSALKPGMEHLGLVLLSLTHEWLPPTESSQGVPRLLVTARLLCPTTAIGGIPLSDLGEGSPVRTTLTAVVAEEFNAALSGRLDAASRTVTTQVNPMV